MPIDRADTLLDLLAESQLLTPAQVEECRGTLASFPDTKALARHLLQRDWLTAYQVNQVLQGKAGDLVLDTYVLLERVGQGGMGQVFKARHSVMNRVVALKIIRPERLANPELVRRFRREMQMAAKLAHPNIVIAYDAKQVGDTHILVMEYVEGTDLARLVEKNGPRPVTQACDFVRQAALGLQHAHERGLVHRDIKPANLLLAVKENTVKVLDMGLARLSQTADADLTAAGLTQEGTVMGTPDYMAPEQAEDTTTVDTRADVYSLGCTLYFLLTGSAPFPKGTLAQKLRKHAQAEPAPLGSFRGDVPAGLVAVLRRMMAKDPEERYQTPGEAAAALEPFCRTGPVAAIPVAGAAGRPVAVPVSEETVALMPPPVAVPVAVPAAETVPPSMLDSVTEQTRRRPSPAAQVKAAWQRLGRRGQIAAAAGAAVVLLLLVIVLWPRRPAPPPQPPEPEPVGLFKLDPKKVPQVERRHWHPKEFDDMLVAVLGEHRARVPSPVCLAVRPDGKKLAFSGPNAVLVDAETLHRDNDEKGLTEKGGTEYAGWVSCLTFSTDNRLLVTGSHDKTVRLWDGETGQAVATFDGMHDGPVYAVAITRDGRRVLSAGEDKVVRVWDVTTRKQVAAYTGHTTPVHAVAVTPDGKHAFSAGGTNAAGELADREVQMWPLETASSEEVRRFKGHDGVITQLAVSPDGKRLLAAGGSSNVWLWDLAAPEKPVALAAEPRPNYSAAAAFLPDGRVATRANSGVFKVWENPKALDASTRPLFTGPELPSGPTLACYPDNRRVAVPTGTSVRVWDVEKKEEWHAPVGAQGQVTHLALGGGRWLLTAGQDLRMRLWDLETGRQMGEAFGEIPTNQTFSGVAVSADGLNAFAATAGDSVRLWETRTGRNVRTFTSPKEPRLGPVALSPDGKRLLSADKGLVLWDTATPDPEPMRRFGGHANAVVQLGFLADDTHPRRAFSYDGAELQVWQDVDRDEEVRRLAISGSVVAVARDADPVYAGDGGGHVMHWHDLMGGKPRKWPFEDLHTQGITAVALAPDGKTLATAGYDRRLIVWDLTESRPKGKEWQPMVGGVTALLFAPDSRHLIVATGNTTVYVLRLPARV